MITLVDGDILIYRTGFASADRSESIAVSRLEHQLEVIKRSTSARTLEIYLSDTASGNFRYGVFEQYKGNRVAKKPTHYELLSNALTEAGGIVAWGEEADDALGIRATELGEHCTIASIDKDLLQIPGRHYNWVTDKFRTVGVPEGRYRFYEQILVGDQVDNITSANGLSCPGVGKTKAFLYLEGCDTHESYKRELWTVFKEYLPECTDKERYTRIEKTGQLVKIRTKRDEIWQYDYKIPKQVGRGSRQSTVGHGSQI